MCCVLFAVRSALCSQDDMRCVRSACCTQLAVFAALYSQYQVGCSVEFVVIVFNVHISILCSSLSP